MQSNKTHDDAKRRIPLKTPSDLVEANEWMFNRQRSGTLDAKSADAMNTTIKGQKAIIIDVPLQVLKLAVQAQIKKVQIDPSAFTRLGLVPPVVPPAITEG